MNRFSLLSSNMTNSILSHQTLSVARGLIAKLTSSKMDQYGELKMPLAYFEATLPDRYELCGLVTYLYAKGMIKTCLKSDISELFLVAEPAVSELIEIRGKVGRPDIFFPLDLYAIANNEYHFFCTLKNGLSMGCASFFSGVKEGSFSLVFSISPENSKLLSDATEIGVGIYTPGENGNDYELIQIEKHFSAQHITAYDESIPLGKGGKSLLSRSIRSPDQIGLEDIATYNDKNAAWRNAAMTKEDVYSIVAINSCLFSLRYKDAFKLFAKTLPNNRELLRCIDQMEGD